MQQGGSRNASALSALTRFPLSLYLTPSPSPSLTRRRDVTAFSAQTISMLVNALARFDAASPPAPTPLPPAAAAAAAQAATSQSGQRAAAGEAPAREGGSAAATRRAPRILPSYPSLLGGNEGWREVEPGDRSLWDGLAEKALSLPCSDFTPQVLCSSRLFLLTRPCLFHSKGPLPSLPSSPFLPLTSLPPCSSRFISPPHSCRSLPFQVPGSPPLLHLTSPVPQVPHSRVSRPPPLMRLTSSL